MTENRENSYATFWPWVGDKIVPNGKSGKERSFCSEIAMTLKKAKIAKIQTKDWEFRIVQYKGRK